MKKTFVIKDVITQSYYAGGNNFKGFLYAEHFYTYEECEQIISRLKGSFVIEKIFTNQ